MSALLGQVGVEFFIGDMTGCCRFALTSAKIMNHDLEL